MGDHPRRPGDGRRTAHAAPRPSSTLPELLGTGQVSDENFKRIADRFGERGVIDLIGAVGYYSLVSMVLNVDGVPLPAGETPPLKPLG